MFPDMIIPAQYHDVFLGGHIEVYVHDWGTLNGQTVVQFSTSSHPIIRYFELAPKPLSDGEVTQELLERELKFHLAYHHGLNDVEIIVTGWQMGWKDNKITHSQ